MFYPTKGYFAQIKRQLNLSLRIPVVNHIRYVMTMGCICDFVCSYLCFVNLRGQAVRAIIGMC